MKTTEEIADDVISRIERDITGRKGLGNEWESIRPEIKQDIRTAWKFHVMQGMNSCIGSLDLSEVWREYFKPRP